MAPTSSSGKVNRTWLKYLAVSLVITSLLAVSYQFNLLSIIEATSIVHWVATENVAYVGFLSTSTTEDEVDHYLTAMRTMAYKLLHGPATKTRKNTPLIVMANDNVAQWKIDQLVKDGVTVRHVDDVKRDWALPATDRWADQFTKLRMWEMTEWDRILYLDADMIIRIDRATLPRQRSWLAKDKPDEASAPPVYVFAGIDDTGRP